MTEHTCECCGCGLPVGEAYLCRRGDGEMAHCRPCLDAIVTREHAMVRVAAEAALGDPPPASPEDIERLGERGARVSAMEGRILGDWHRADEAGTLPPWVASRPRNGFLPCGCFLDRDLGTTMTPGTGEPLALTACRDHLFLVEAANKWEDRACELESKLGRKGGGDAEDG